MLMSSFSFLQHRALFEKVQKKEDFSTTVDFLLLRQFSARDLKISYRELNHWSSKGLLFEQNEEGKWRRFNVIEYIWLQIVKELRFYNFPINIIKLIKDQFESIRMQEALNTFSIEEMKEFLKYTLDPDQVEDVFKTVDLNLLGKNWMHLEPEANFSLFEMAVIEAYYLKTQHFIFINYKGEWTLVNELYYHEQIESEVFRDRFGSSYLSISINNVISKLFKNYSTRDLHLRWKLLNDDEAKAIELIHTIYNLKSVTIKLNENREIDLLEYKHSITATREQYLKSLLLSGAYETINIVTQKGDVVHCEKTVKVKALKKSGR